MNLRENAELGRLWPQHRHHGVAAVRGLRTQPRTGRHGGESGQAEHRPAHQRMVPAFPDAQLRRLRLGQLSLTEQPGNCSPHAVP